MYENLNIGNEIRYYRMKQKLSQEKLAEKVIFHLTSFQN